MKGGNLSWQQKQVQLFIYIPPNMQKPPDYHFGELKEVLGIILFANKCRKRKNNLGCPYRLWLNCSEGRKKAANPSGIALHKRFSNTYIQIPFPLSVSLDWKHFYVIIHFVLIWTSPYEKTCSRNSCFLRNL